MRVFAEDYALIELANSRVTMSQTYQLLGIPDGDYAASGAKVDCPFVDVFHPTDRKTFRVYDDSGGYCFVCTERYSPVSITSLMKQVSPTDAAEALLQATGYAPKSADERFTEALEAPDVDRNSLAEALKTYCERTFPLWGVDQFEDRVGDRLRKLLDILPAVRTREDARAWLEKSKESITAIMEEVTRKDYRAETH